MAAAVSLITAANLAQRNAVLKLGAGANLNTLLNSWAAAIATALTDPESLEQRRMLDWIPRIKEVAQGISTTVLSQTLNDANDLGTILYRSCIAGWFTTGVTAPQKAALLASYNTLFA